MATSVVEIIVRLKFGPSALLAAFTSKPQAIRWFKNWLIAQDQRLQQCMVLRTVAMERNGWGLKVRFDRMAEDALEDSIASLRQLVGRAGTVTVLTDEEVALEIVHNETFKEKQMRRVSAVGNYERTSSVVAQLGQLIGEPSEAGPTKKQKRAAVAAMELLNRSHNIGSAGLREAHSDDEDNVA